MTIYMASLVGLSSAVKIYEINKNIKQTNGSILVYESPNHQRYKKSKQVQQNISFIDQFNPTNMSRKKLNHLKNEWKLIALIFDRFFFWLYLILTFSFSVIILIIVPNLKNFWPDSLN